MTVRSGLSYYILLFSLGAYAAADKYSTPAKIIGYNVGTTGSVYIYTQGTETNPKGCSTGTSYILRSGHVAYKALYLAILSSFYSGQEMGFLISGTECISNRPVIKSIQGR